MFTLDNHQAFEENNRRQQGANLGDQHYASHAVTFLQVHQNTTVRYETISVIVRRYHATTILICQSYIPFVKICQLTMKLHNEL